LMFEFVLTFFNSNKLDSEEEQYWCVNIYMQTMMLFPMTMVALL
jgi:hypothetical protein